MPIEKSDYPVKSFRTAEAFRKWLEAHHARAAGLRLRFFKKDSGKKSITYAEALDVALCYGWIDGHVKKFDEKSWAQKFTPRRARSAWSRRNTEHVKRLTAAGLMRPAGMAAIEAAKAEGRWAAAYDSPRNMQVPADFLERLSKDRKALAFFKTLNRVNVYAIAYRLQNVKKAETRERRMMIILEMMKRAEKFH